MELTLKISEKTKAGKALLDIIDYFVNTNKSIKIVEKDDSDEYLYSEAFIKKIRKAEQNIKEGKTTRIENVEEFWKSL